MYGYDHVTPTFLPTAKVTTGGLSDEQKRKAKLKKTLCGTGAYECIHYSFFSPSDLDMLRYADDAVERNAIKILNPINEDLSLMRTTLAASMLNAIARNEKRGNMEGRLFEIANIFLPKELPLKEYPDEHEVLCVGLFGAKESFFTLKGIAETIAESLCIKFTYEKAEKPFLHPYQTAAIMCEGTQVGYLGKVAYDIQDDLDMPESAYLMEIDLAILSQWFGKRPMFTPLPKFAEEKRDLALLMDRGVTCGQVEEAIAEACDYIKSIKLFDVYQGSQIPADKKSMAFTIEFTPKDEAFAADSVDGFIKKILKNLNKKLSIDIRS